MNDMKINSTLPFIPDNKIKKYAIFNIVCGLFGEVTLLFYLTKTYPILNWQLIGASLLLVTGVLLIINIVMLRTTTFKEKKVLFYAIIINPGLVSIFTAITVILIQYPKLQYIYLLTGLFMIASIIIGFGVFVAALIKKSG